MKSRALLTLLLCALLAFAASQVAFAATGVPTAFTLDPDPDPEAATVPAPIRGLAAVRSTTPATYRGRLSRSTVQTSQRIRKRPRGTLLAHVRRGRSVALHSRPGGPVVVRLGSATEFGSPRALPVAARRGPWLGVTTSARPNGRLAWVRARSRALRLTRTPYSLHADLSRRRVALRRGGRVLERLAVTVGRPGSETPTGRFAVTDKLAGTRFSPYYGCCILALSGNQPSPPPGWRGGNRLAIHGTNAPATIGTASSAGCLRAGGRELRVLMRHVPLGTPVFIRP
jgi:lipoprotein-anchoring transpeptidase ErfK/SrfK